MLMKIQSAPRKRQDESGAADTEHWGVKCGKIELTSFCVSGDDDTTAARSRDTESGPEHGKDR